MDLFAVISIIIVLSALFGYLNVRFIKLPNTIGMMVIAIVFTLALLGSSYFTDFFLESAKKIIEQIDFETLLLDVMLGFLLFAGAMHTNFDQPASSAFSRACFLYDWCSGLNISCWNHRLLCVSVDRL